MSAHRLKQVVAVLYLISVLEVIARNLFGPFFAVYVSKLGGDPLASGTAVAINTFVIGVGMVASGRFATKFKTEKIQMVIGFGLSSLVYLGYIAIKHPWQLFILETISGIAIAISLPAFSGMYSSTFQKNKHASGWGDYLGAMNIVSAVTLLTSGFVVQKFGFNTLFTMMFIFQFLGMLAALSLFKFKRTSDNSTLEIA